MIITPIKQAIYKGANRTVDFINRNASKAMDTKFAHALMPENPTDLAKTLALISTTTKDAVNCYYYTTQSYNNKKIPEDKRKFVAGIDLANGILNVITQFTLGMYVNKKSDKWFDKLLSGGVSPTTDAINKYRKDADAILSKFNIKCTDGNIEKAIKTFNKVTKSGFGVILVLVVTQILAKRVIVPFLATPLAGVFKDIMEKHQNGKSGNVVQNNDTSSQQSVVNNISVAPFTTTHEAFKGFEQFMNKR